MKPTESIHPTLSDRVQFRQRRRKEVDRRRSKPPLPTEPDWEESIPAIGTMARTKRLIMAALRVWELKHGIRD